MYIKKHTPSLPTEDFIFGTRAIIETILAGKSIAKIFINPAMNGSSRKTLMALIQQYQIPYSPVPVEKLNRITRKNHQGAIALLAPIPFASLSHVIQARYEQGGMPLVLVLDGITDVRNMGAVVRTAVCTGVDALVIPTQGSAALGGDAMKASAGALSHIAICRVAQLTQALHYLQESGLQLVACHEKATDSLYTTDFRSPVALVLGSEGQGISPACRKLSTQELAIPILGPIASLNVSVAAGVVLYEIFRQRNIKSKQLNCV